MFDFLKSDAFKAGLVSAGNTALATFVTFVASSLASGDIKWTGAFWSALLVSAVRAAWKAVISKYVPVSLGGSKQQ